MFISHKIRNFKLKTLFIGCVSGNYELYDTNADRRLQWRQDKSRIVDKVYNEHNLLYL